MTNAVAGQWDPAIFGWWKAVATSDIDQNVVNDTIAFQVGWKAQVTFVIVNNAPYLKYSDMMNFTMTVSTIGEQPTNALVSIDAYDASSYPIGEVAMFDNVSATRNNVNGLGGTAAGVFTYTVIMPIPYWARVGAETVTGYVLTNLPSKGGLSLDSLRRQLSSR
jgi:hypothetical protein